MKIFIETLGCKVNTYESEVIKEEFLRNGYELADNLSDANVIVVNTCSVTNQSDAKSRKVIRNARKNNKNAILVVCGCSSQNHQDELKDLGADILIGNKDKSKIFDYVNNYDNKQIINYYNMINTDFEKMSLDNYSERTRAFVKIQDGCNNYCSYCIIPYLRGTIRNKDLNDAINEINTLVNNGFKEIVLTGIHTGSYPELVKLIQEISKNDKLERIRISSIEATEINDEFLKELKNNNKICNHMHIPVQAACDNTLKKMNRKYDMNKFKEIINKIREVRPDINITTDLIVGFPTETKEDFLESYNNANEIKFGKIHVFPYSKRDGTVAAKMKSIVTDAEKKERTHKMITLSNKLENEYYNKFIDKTLSVLVEEVFDKYCTGHTDNYIKVIINKKLEHNKFYNVKIIKVDNCNVYGEVE
ncbi:MAG: tRNA (N(6)-L-threonylcarbamoyladenosine(37)-C(2))-methylthiotransferase MtaB [Bacilli bacterium]|nr:tRNA (N(6)-L-threonylcarbamoyladenosine(37)-C(2))-methylthiotransferase MtaB [Bacilli bacterium]MCI6932546.1 tRNA (N(6)-L-threonylcarbamoyladenosine(37)-C(2))-methylthiotransferase MtaB [Mycoplasmatota bacterium]